jgi:hypothetical protein
MERKKKDRKSKKMCTHSRACAHTLRYNFVNITDDELVICEPAGILQYWKVLCGFIHQLFSNRFGSGGFPLF